jgi:hypothetical protein
MAAGVKGFESERGDEKFHEAVMVGDGVNACRAPLAEWCNQLRCNSAGDATGQVPGELVGAEHGDGVTLEVQRAATAKAEHGEETDVGQGGLSGDDHRRVRRDVEQRKER